MLVKASFVVTALLSEFAAGAVYYVAPDGSDVSGNGSRSSPWKSPGKPKSVLRPGDTVYFRGGDYPLTEPVYVNGSAGTSAAPIVYASYPGETARIVFDRRVRLADVTLHHVFHVARAFHVFERLTIYQTRESRAFATAITGDPANDQYQRVGGYGIFAPGVKIRNCRIENMAGVGLYTDHSGANALVEGTVVVDTYLHSFYVAGVNGIYRNNVLDGARGYNNHQGIQIQWAGTKGNKVFSNVIRNSRAACVNFSGPVTDNDVFNNILIDCGLNPTSAWGSALAFWHQGGKVGTGNRFFNNTVFGKRPKSSVIAPNDGAPVDIFNNIFRFDAPAPVGGAAGYRIHDNIFFNGTSVPPGNRNVDPLLANPTGADPRGAWLLKGSPALNTAVIGAPANDYDGTLRPQGAGPDVGAYEVTGAVPKRSIPGRPTELRVR